MQYSLTTIQTNKFRAISSSLIIRTPIDKKTVTYNTLLTMVLRNSCEKYDSIKKINEKLEDTYGMFFYADVLKKGTQHIIQFYTEVLCDHFETCIEFLSDIVTKPYLKNGSFDEKIFANEKETLTKIIRSRKDDKKNYAKNRCFEEIFSGNSFGIYADGYEDILSEITPYSLYSYYKTLLITPFDFFIVGNIKEKTAEDTIKKYFEGYTRYSFMPPDIYDIKPPEKERIVTEKDDLTQSIVCLSYRTDGNFTPLIIGNEILGGGGNSLLFSDVRESLGLCYNISSSVYRFSHVLLIQTGIDIANLTETIEMTKKTIEKIRTGKFDEQSLDSAKKTLIYQYTILYDKKSSITDNALLHAMIQDNQTSDAIIDKIKKINKKDIINAFSKIIPDTTYILEAE